MAYYLSGTVVIPTFAVPMGDLTEDGPKTAFEIYNGDNAQPNAWPFMVLLLREGSFRCGASLVAERWVVTAAHCVDA